jgi:hypothetical protein
MYKKKVQALQRSNLNRVFRNMYQPVTPAPAVNDEVPPLPDRADTPPESQRYTILPPLVEDNSVVHSATSTAPGACPYQNPQCPRYRPPQPTAVDVPAELSAPALQMPTYQGVPVDQDATGFQGGDGAGPAAPFPDLDLATDPVRRRLRTWANTAPYNRTFLDQVQPHAVPPYVEPVQDANGATRSVKSPQ